MKTKTVPFCQIPDGKRFRFKNQHSEESAIKKGNRYTMNYGNYRDQVNKKEICWYYI